MSIFGTGGGPVTGTQGMLSLTQTPTMSLDGQALPAGAVSFAGLAPGFQGLWQYNAAVPKTLPNGSAIWTSSAHTVTLGLNGSVDSADILVGPGVGGTLRLRIRL